MKNLVGRESRQEFSFGLRRRRCSELVLEQSVRYVDGDGAVAVAENETKRKILAVHVSAPRYVWYLREAKRVSEQREGTVDGRRSIFSQSKFV